jgi:uncharacterized protein (UPF0548 family)
MPRQTFIHRLGTAALWPVGVALTSWRYMWRTTPLYRSEEPGSLPEDAPPPLPGGVSRSEVQGPDDGAGALYHRRYEVTIRGSELSATELVARVAEDPDRVSPSEFAKFKKTLGREGQMAVGDEYLVRMPGPWDGPVRVLEHTPDAFRLATLEGHLEAGQIRFGAESRDGLVVFRIESWARGGDRLSNLLYDRLRFSKEVQFHMWTSFLEHVVELSGGEREGGLRVHTRRVEAEPPGHPRALERLRALHDADFNFELPAIEENGGESGWKVDDYCQPLPAEAPGPPEPDGTWRRAQQLMRDYEFADPAIVRALYAPDSELEGRDMLLEARFWGLRFRFGVRVGAVTDEQREVDGRPVCAWGWSYRTLQGHLEMGQMDYEVWKWLDDGSVEFRIHVVSRPARIPNPIVRLGFRLFGRGQQVRFARRACARMAERIDAGSADKPPVRTSETRPAPG